MKIQFISNHKKIEENEWSNFVINHHQGNIFQSPEFYKTVLQTNEWSPIILGIKVNGILEGIIVSVIQSDGIGLKRLFSLRNIVWGAPLVKSHDCIGPLLNYYNKINRNKSNYIQFRNLFDLSTAKSIYEKEGYTFKDHLNIYNNISGESDDILKRMHKERRRNIKIAQRKGLLFREILSEDELKECYIILTNLYNKIKLPLPSYNFFLTFHRVLNTYGNIKIFVGIVNDDIVAFRFVLCYKKCIYDWYAASMHDYLGYYPNDYLLWKIMEWGNINGYESFDFGGAGSPNKYYGVRDYKIKFGGVLVNYGRYERYNKPIIYKIGKIGLKLYQKY
jgi:serine/alanine adding enzyme